MTHVPLFFENDLLKYCISQSHRQGDIKLQDCPTDIKYDFSLQIHNKIVVFEIEKANKEKILYDFLKLHVDLSNNADLVVLLVPKNWAHNSGSCNLFELAVQRYNLCRDYGIVDPKILGHILTNRF